MDAAWRWAAATAAAALLCWTDSVRSDFVDIDDLEYVCENPHMAEGLKAENVAWAVRSCGYAENWHPLCWISLMADVSVLRLAERVVGLEPGALFSKHEPERRCPGWTGQTGWLPRVMHAHNILLHAANATLLFLLIVAMTGRGRKDGAAEALAALLAIVWAVHPLRAEAVCWVSERKELLSVFFMLLTFLCHVKGRWWAELAFFAFALASKPVAVTLPAALLAWDWIVCGKRFRAAVWRMLPAMALSAGVCALTLVAQTKAIECGRMTPTANRITYILDAPIIYLRQMLWPVGLSLYYPEKDSPHWVGAVVGLALLGGIVWVTVRWLRRRERWAAVLAFGVAWCYVGLMPMLGIVRVAGQPHSDRYTYWVGCGLAATMAMLLQNIGWRMYINKGLAMAAAAFALLAQGRTAVWRDSLALARDALPKSWDERASIMLSQHAKHNGASGMREAELALRETVSHNPSAESFANLGRFLVFAQQGNEPDFGLEGETKRMAEACHWAICATNAYPDCAIAYETLGLAAAANGEYGMAVGLLERAISLGRGNEAFVADMPRLRKLAEEKDKDVR